MPVSKTKKNAEASVGCQKISNFFTRKRPLEEVDEDHPELPPPKRPSPPTADLPISTLSPTPPPQSPLSPEQKLTIERKKLEAESKLFARKFGAEQLGLSWFKALRAEFKRPYMDKLIKFLMEERSKTTVYPSPTDVFTWTTACAITEVKVVILGQDPYHGPGQAHGLSFSVRVGVPPPPSLMNMYKELGNDVEGFERPDHGFLMGWAKQGVLLLNACLTVQHKQPKSHSEKGWEKLTDAVVHWLNDNRSGLVFLLWGKDAQKKGSFINSKKHCILKSVHPSPLSAHRGFLGCRHFSKANQYLKEKGKAEIDWNCLPRK